MQPRLVTNTQAERYTLEQEDNDHDSIIEKPVSGNTIVNWITKKKDKMIDRKKRIPILLRWFYLYSSGVQDSYKLTPTGIASFMSNVYMIKICVFFIFTFFSDLSVICRTGYEQVKQVEDNHRSGGMLAVNQQTSRKGYGKLQLNCWWFQTAFKIFACHETDQIT